MSRCRAFSFIPLVIRRNSSSIAQLVLLVVIVVVVVVVVVVMVMVMVVMTGVSGGLLLASLVDGRTLGDTVVMTLPDDIGVGREVQQTFDCLSAEHVSKLAMSLPTGCVHV